MRERLLAYVLTAAFAVACSGGDKPAAATWEAAFDTQDTGFLSSVWGSGPNDVFIVGGTRDRAEVYHYDGADWTPTIIDGQGLFVWVYGFSPNNVYAVGIDGSAAQYDGTTWTKWDVPTTDDLWGIWGTSPTDLWLVGGSIATGDPVLMHYDGTDFTSFDLDSTQNPLGVHALFKLWGIGDRILTVGQNGLVLEYDGSNWARVSAGTEADDDFVSLYGTRSDDIVLVGGRGGARIATVDGAAFATSKPGGVPGLSAVWADADTVFVGGLGGFVGKADRTTGTIEAEVTVDRDVHALWGDEQGRVYAVGGVFAEPFIGTAHVRVEE